jgi:hypothetical protein
MASLVSSFDIVAWGVLDFEFDGVTVCCPVQIFFNGNSFAFRKLLWRSTKLQISDGAMSRLDEEVICPMSLGWLLHWCGRRVTGVGIFLRG